MGTSEFWTVPPLQSDLEVLNDRSMPGMQRHHIGDWVLRCGVGATGRANTSWPTGQPGMAVDAAIDEVEAWYGERSQRPGFQVFDGASTELTNRLAERGYVEAPGAQVMWGRISEMNLVPSNPPPDWEIRRSPVIDPALAAAIENPGRVKEISTSRLAIEFVSVFDVDGHFLGGGKAATSGNSVGIFAMLTAPEFRRRGVAGQVLKQLLLGEPGDSAAESDRWAWLQVMENNSSAISLYSKLGFETTHRYVYKFGPSPQSG